MTTEDRAIAVERLLDIISYSIVDIIGWDVESGGEMPFSARCIKYIKTNSKWKAACGAVRCEAVEDVPGFLRELWAGTSGAAW